MKRAAWLVGISFAVLSCAGRVIEDTNGASPSAGAAGSGSSGGAAGSGSSGGAAGSGITGGAAGSGITGGTVGSGITGGAAGIEAGGPGGSAGVSAGGGGAVSTTGGSAGVMPEGGLTCGASAEVAYNAPGCGANAPAPYCQSVPTDGCAGVFCGCDGKTLYGGCGYSAVPFAAAGPCPDGGPADADASAAPCRGALEYVRTWGAIYCVPTYEEAIEQAGVCFGFGPPNGSGNRYCEKARTVVFNDRMNGTIKGCVYGELPADGGTALIGAYVSGTEKYFCNGHYSAIVSGDVTPALTRPDAEEGCVCDYAACTGYTSVPCSRYIGAE
jgi:hypothetical protein